MFLLFPYNPRLHIVHAASCYMGIYFIIRLIFYVLCFLFLGYSNFLIKGNHLLRNAIVAPDIKLLTIQDNNPPHKTDMVYETFSGY